ncbi:MAG: deoxyribose-phosphate aldolase [Acholeplasmataceae bacterium]|jgi:deoxyribose-phosphate aldolase
MKLNQYIDHTKLGPTVTKNDVKKLVEEARKYEFFSVCVNTTFVKYAKELVEGSNVKIATVIGFPHGTHTPAVKAFETAETIKDGADEIDMVLNVNALKDKDYDLVLADIKGVVKAAAGKVVKVIIETCYLTKEEIVKASQLCVKAKAHFVKTSTGFGPRGASVEDVELIDETVNGKAEIKASGGIRTYEDAMAMIEAGATRLGASKGVEIMEGVKVDDSDTSY